MTARRMRCERYHANIPVSTCLARQRRARQPLAQWWHSGVNFDPGCARCAQGMEIEMQAAGTGRLKEAENGGQ